MKVEENFVISPSDEGQRAEVHAALADARSLESMIVRAIARADWGSEDAQRALWELRDEYEALKAE